MGNWRQRINNFAMDTLDLKHLMGKLDNVSDNLMCSSVEYSLRLCAQKRRREELKVFLCTRKQNTIGLIETFGYYRRLDKNQEANNKD